METKKAMSFSEAVDKFAPKDQKSNMQMIVEFMQKHAEGLNYYDGFKYSSFFFIEVVPFKTEEIEGVVYRARYEFEEFSSSGGPATVDGDIEVQIGVVYVSRLGTIQHERMRVLCYSDRSLSKYGIHVDTSMDLDVVFDIGKVNVIVTNLPEKNRRYVYKANFTYDILTNNWSHNLADFTPVKN